MPTRTNRRALWSFEVVALSALLSACKDDALANPPRLSIAELKDSKTCMSCHPTHYREWKASMHAYASDDPVFLAMNALGQEETNGELGDFCVSCHAPMALRGGFVDGGVLAEDTPEHMKGITCYFCHNVESVTGDHNAEVELANDDVMRGTIEHPIEPSAHGVSFSSFLDRKNPKSSKFCGGCHDIVNDNGVHLERTFAEYNETAYSRLGSEEFQTCVICHMPYRQGLAAVDDGRPGEDEQVGSGGVHSHLWPGVDVALTSWPDAAKYEAAVTYRLDTAISVGMTTGMSNAGGILYAIETGSGHSMPSGASQDRRMWIEMIAYDSEGNIVCVRGRVPHDVAVTKARETEVPLCPMNGKGAPSPNDPIQFPLFRDRIFDEAGDETHRFWRAASSDAVDGGVISNLLPGLKVSSDGMALDHGVEVEYGPFEPLDVQRVTVRLKIRPMDYDVLDELIESGHLSESIREEVRTFTIAYASVDFELTDAGWVGRSAPERNIDGYDVYFCAFDPDAPLCN